MFVCIIWSENSEIISVYGNRKTVLNMIEKNEWDAFYEYIDKPDDSYIIGYNKIHPSDAEELKICNVSPLCKQLYFLSVYENGGGQSYYNQVQIYMSETINDALDWACTWFNDEHNRDDGYDACNECNNAKQNKVESPCRIKMCEELQSKFSTCIYGNRSEIGMSLKKFILQ